MRFLFDSAGREISISIKKTLLVISVLCFSSVLSSSSFAYGIPKGAWKWLDKDLHEVDSMSEAINIFCSWYTESLLNKPGVSNIQCIGRGLRDDGYIIVSKGYDFNGLPAGTGLSDSYAGVGVLLPDEPKSSCQEPESSHPVKLSRGEKYYKFDDVVAGTSLFPLLIQRRYKTDVRYNANPRGEWFWSYLSNGLIDRGGGNITVVLSDGMYVNFSSCGTSCVMSQRNGGYYSLNKNTSTSPFQWELLRPDGYREIYSGTNGHLLKMVSPEGLIHSLSYAGDPVTTITIQDEQTGQLLTATVNIVGMPVFLRETTDPLSSVTLLSYSWDERGRLTAVTDQSGFIQRFTYDSVKNSGFNTLITGLDEESSGIVRHYSNVVYDVLGRVTTSELKNDEGSGVETSTFSYNWDWTNTSGSFVPKTTITNSSSLQTKYSFTTNGHGITGTRNWQVTAVDGASDAVSGCAATSVSTTYSGSSDPEGAGYLKTTTDSTGNVVTKRTRDSQGRITVLQTGLDNTQSPVASSLKTETTYAGSASRPSTRMYSGHTGGSWSAYRSEAFGYDGNNRLSSRSVTDALNSTTRSWSYSNSYNGVVLSSMVMTGPRNHATTYSYNGAGQLTAIQDALGNITSYGNYNGFGLPETVTDPNGVATTLTYDVRGRLTGSSTDGAATTISYWPNGLVKRVTQPNGTWLEYAYNSAHQLTGISNQLGENIALTPSVLNGQWTTAAVTNGTNTVTYNRAFDALGRLWKAQDASGMDKTVFNYDANDNLRAVIALGDVGNGLAYDDTNRVTVRTYDGQNRVTSESRCTDSAAPTPPYSCASPLAVTSYTYDDQGNIKTVTDPNGHVTSYTYNGFGELVTQVSPDTGTTTYTYDAAGNLVTKTKGYGTGDAQTISYTWDALNRLSGIDYPGTDQDVSYTYDQGTNGKGHLTQVVDGSGTTDYTYNTLGQVTSKTETIGSLVQVTGYQYNSAGQLTTVTYPNGQQVASTYSSGKLNSLLDASFSTTLASNLTHQPFAGLNGWDVPTTVQGVHFAKQFDANGRLNTFGMISADQSAGWGQTIEYDAYGNISASRLMSDNTQGEEYQYDALNRLTQVTASYGRLSYSYDANGNRTQTLNEQRNPTTQAWQEKYTETYAIDGASNRLNSVTRTKGGTTTTPLRTRSFAYDGRGNIKTDTRQRGTSSPLIYPLHYGNSDRLNSIATP